jgi:hypothetical protein
MYCTIQSVFKGGEHSGLLVPAASVIYNKGLLGIVLHCTVI